MILPRVVLLEESKMKKFLVSALLAFGLAVSAQTWPDRPVKITVGFQPGGGTDIAARVFAKNLSEIWRVPVVVENRPGAGGNLGIKHMLEQPADGYTMSSIQSGNLSIQHELSSPGYNWLTDLTIVSYLGEATPYVVVVNSKTKISNMREFESWARTKTLSYAFPGIGVPHHIYGTAIAMHIGTDMIPVPYKGVPPMINDLLGGTLDFLVLPTSQLIVQHVQSGNLTVVGVISDRPSKVFPQAKTMAQQGYDSLYVKQLYGIAVPSNTPPAIVQKIRADAKVAWERAMAEELKEKSVADPVLSRWPDNFENYTQSSQALWHQLIKRTKISKIE